ncbi:MAG: IS66 family insertion sequence element accessory protein TnpB [Desulfobulbaceae bacterium]|uniref:IS66 family insertion sequence element accessory protein TnpB n=1 Tax=Candidatus Desulfobia pelagia TaxID=2841692 RepID=A0A8J6NDW9_9BACT|nr:IS66 family insertion sequence element accessory protein TnpB [Candidatus Desulfobia pelagia]
MPKELSEKKTVSNKKTWQAHLKAWSQSNLSGTEYCRQYQLSYYAFIYWKKKLGSLLSPSVELVPVPMKIHSSNTATALKVEVGGRFKVEIPDDFTPGTLTRIITTLEACR